MAESETVQTKTKLQQEHERLDFEAAVRLQSELRKKEALGSTRRSSKLEIILRFNFGSYMKSCGASLSIDKGIRHLHAGREGVSIVKGNSYIDAGSKALGGSR
ncbi:hypothetical protein Tco_0877388 [Tanacetum coccineum]|uniref:UVR domain-containing protein n=1 Tax=Tanacetum coccineum TaxID=301880 RepID=A0ABQ5BXJ0_9ASTR